MDWRLYHGIYSVSLHHHWLGTFFSDVEKASIPFMVIATAALWLLDRPGGARKWKLASASALASAAVALLIAQVIAKTWPRERPFVAHPGAHVWGARSHDPSFPSDHAAAGG